MIDQLMLMMDLPQIDETSRRRIAVAISAVKALQADEEHGIPSQHGAWVARRGFRATNSWYVKNEASPWHNQSQAV